MVKIPYFQWSRRWDLNPRPADYESAALPPELRRHNNKNDLSVSMNKNQKKKHSDSLLMKFPADAMFSNVQGCPDLTRLILYPDCIRNITYPLL